MECLSIPAFLLGMEAAGVFGGEKVHLKISMLRMDQKAVDTLKKNTPDPVVKREGWGVEYDLHESYSDGRKDNISFVQPGSGFLAVDKNNDGKINNGKELFGPNTGNGFDELAKYDSDGNQWIDESDPSLKS